jgi:hypothetical protein
VAKNSNVNALNFEIDALKRLVKVLEHQQERMYSEEDMEHYADYIWKSSNDNRYKSPLTPKQWFEQFKKTKTNP